MSVQTQVGLLPASSTVRRTIEVKVLRGTLGNCILDCATCANSASGSPHLKIAQTRGGFVGEALTLCSIDGAVVQVCQASRSGTAIIVNRFDSRSLRSGWTSENPLFQRNQSSVA
jgi:hypothetical protein